MMRNRLWRMYSINRSVVYNSICVESNRSAILFDQCCLQSAIIPEGAHFYVLRTLNIYVLPNYRAKRNCIWLKTTDDAHYRSVYQFNLLILFFSNSGIVVFIALPWRAAPLITKTTLLSLLKKSQGSALSPSRQKYGLNLDYLMN